MQIVSTDGFWKVLCSVKCVRISKYQAFIENTRYVTMIPPETVDGFIESKIAEVHRLLRIKPLKE